MKNNEITWHKILQQASIYSYDLATHKIPQGYNLLGTSSSQNGFFACVLLGENNIIISYRGTNFKEFKDIQNDLSMWAKKKPEQAINALKLYDKIHYEYPYWNITVTGHSLGGSLAQIVGATRNVETVTFNAYGTRNFLEKYVARVFDDKIINYCNPKDLITTINAKNHIGMCYQINSNNSNKNSHLIEKMQPLENRIEATKGELQDSWYKTSNTNLEYYNRTGKQTPITMPSMSSGCIGSYPVSGYTKKDGTKVSGYIRTCGAKHE